MPIAVNKAMTMQLEPKETQITLISIFLEADAPEYLDNMLIVYAQYFCSSSNIVSRSLSAKKK